MTVGLEPETASGAAAYSAGSGMATLIVGREHPSAGDRVRGRESGAGWHSSEWCLARVAFAATRHTAHRPRAVPPRVPAAVHSNDALPPAPERLLFGLFHVAGAARTISRAEGRPPCAAQ